MKPVFKLNPLSQLLALALCGAAGAQPVEHKLPDVVVTGAAIEKRLEDAPASIAVVTRADLERRPVQELAEVLGAVPGVTLTRNGNGVPGVQIRGLSSSYTLILVDGRRVNSGSAVFRGNDYDLGWVPAEEVERIEVVRGPMSSLYGSDAIGGVVNIITRKVGTHWRGSVRLDAIHQENRLAGDSHIAGFSFSGPIIDKQLGLKIYGGADKREADDPALNPAAANGARQAALPGLKNRYVSGQLAWTPSDQHTVTLDLDTSHRDHAGFKLERNALSLRHSGRYDFGRSDLRFYNDDTKNLTGTVTGQTNPNKSKTQVLDGKLSLPLDLLDQNLTIGGEIRHEELWDPANLAGSPGSPARTSPTTTVRQKAVFFEDEIKLAPDLALTLGDRYDDHENFGGHHSPRVYGVWHPAKAWTLRAGWAKAFRAPTLLQNSPDWGSPSCGSATVGCYIVGSRELQPETSTSKELGAAFDGGAWHVGLTVYDTQLKNMLDINNRTSNKTLAPTYANFVGFLPDGRPMFRYQNLASVKSRGAELSSRFTVSPTLSLRANYTYTDAKNTSGAIALPLTYRSKHVANLGADWQALPQLGLSLSGRYNGAQYISVPSNGQNLVQAPAYSVFDASAAWTVNPTFTVRAGLLNLADKTVDRETSNEFNEEGRRLYVSATARF
ncbi:TonB-dependent receptor domain-containing protein [Roseateles sp. LKC17W]|uniref:TonB-dependent receptor domain-containing protein n=1 Tax=Pelomonas margarita TaxID=3299031 RepID=A0ABW7FIN8_9BURK